MEAELGEFNDICYFTGIEANKNLKIPGKR